jgi:hypothetical protein
MPPALVDAAALTLTAAGLAAAAVAVGLTRDWRAAMGMALELWLAAGLLRLSRPGEWRALVVAAVVVAVRQLVTRSLRATARS